MLKRKYVYAKPVDLELHLVDDLVFVKHLLGKFIVSLDQRLHSSLHRSFGRSAKKQYLVPQDVKLFVYDPMIHLK